MPVKTYILSVVSDPGYDYDSYGHHFRQYKRIKAKNIKEAGLIAEAYAIEMRAIDKPTVRRHSDDVSTGRFDVRFGNHTRMLERGNAGIRMFAGKNRPRRGCRNYPPIRPICAEAKQKAVEDRWAWESFEHYPTMIRNAADLVPGNVYYHIHGHIKTEKPTKYLIESVDEDGGRFDYRVDFEDGEGPSRYLQTGYLSDAGIGRLYNHNRFFGDREAAARYHLQCGDRGLQKTWKELSDGYY